jgi:Tol biopolymer transport system component/predicted Ser/Thr protein kinase
MIGTTISHYKITEKLGEGGMGVVYKAEDTSLDRPVALKFLAAHLVSDDDIRKRFEREAKAAAALNHPSICTVHEINEVEGKTFIAMAFLEGQGLDKKIEAGPVKLKDALDIAIQTAKGLQAAHSKGIVHRDIKPANLMAGPDGHITIMDFGLAQLADRSKLTRMDETMGTVTYMSPEQTYGMDLDHRTDVWSLGVVIYEMVTGQQPFKGHYDKAVMYSITNEEPEPMTALRTGVPMELEWLVNKCLAKEANERYQSTADMVVDLETLRKKLESGKSTIMPAQSGTVVTGAPVVTGAHAGPIQGQAESPSLPGPLARYRVIEDIQESDDSIKYVAEDTKLRRSVAIRVLPQSSADEMERAQRRKQTLLLGTTALAVLLALVFAFFPLFPPAPVAEAPLRRSAFTPPVAVNTNRFFAGVAISPNGKYIAYTTAGVEGKLWVQDLDQEQPRAMERTEGAYLPFWSPDSDFIGFAAEANLQKVSVQGGPAMRLCETPSRLFYGGSWSPDGDSVVFSSPITEAADPMIYEVPAQGGVPSLLIGPEESEWSPEGPTGSISRPHFLPSDTGRRVLVFTFGTAGASEMMIQDLETGQREFLGPGDRPFYSPSGHLVYQPERNVYDLWARPFSLETLQTTGEAFPIAQNSRQPTIAADQTLVYLAGSSSAQQQLIWVDRAGEKVEEVGQPAERLRDPALSPDGGRVAVSVTEGSNWDVWVWDLARGVKTRLSTAPELDYIPMWSPDGSELAFVSRRAGNLDIYLRPADGSGGEQAVAATPQNEAPSDWSRDGKYLLYAKENPETGFDLWYLEHNESGSAWEPHPFVQELSNQGMANLSPDGRYAAYLSDESGEVEVLVQPFPEGGRKVTVSNNGGRQLRWSRDGKELFYVEGEKLMAVGVSTEAEFTATPPKELFEHRGLRRLLWEPNYAVSLDGQRFLLPEQMDTEVSDVKIRVVQNWFAEFKDQQQD